MRNLLLSIALLVFAGCTTVGNYNPSFVGTPASVDKPLPGKALVYVTETDANYIYKGKPTSFTGGGTTLSIGLGEITTRIAVSVFGNVFSEGAQHKSTLDEADQFTIVVTPKMTSFSYAYNQIKNLGFAITPQVDMSLDVKVNNLQGATVLQKTYESGMVDGETYMMSGSPGEEVSKAVHKALTSLMNQAAIDTYAAMSSYAARPTP